MNLYTRQPQVRQYTLHKIRDIWNAGTYDSTDWAILLSNKAPAYTFSFDWSKTLKHSDLFNDVPGSMFAYQYNWYRKTNPIKKTKKKQQQQKTTIKNEGQG